MAGAERAGAGAGRPAFPAAYSRYARAHSAGGPWHYFEHLRGVSRTEFLVEPYQEGAHHAAVLAILENSWEQLQEGNEQFSTESAQGFLEVKDGRRSIKVAVDKRSRKVLGFVTYFPPGTPSRSGRGQEAKCHVEMLGTDKDFRRRGVGRALLTSAIEENPFATVSLRTGASNREAQGLCQKLGFRAGGEHPKKKVWSFELEPPGFFQIRRRLNRRVLAGSSTPAELLSQLEAAWPAGKRRAERHILKRQLALNVGLAQIHPGEMTVGRLQKIISTSRPSDQALPRLDVLVIGASVAGLRFANALHEHQALVGTNEKKFSLHIHVFERNFVEARNQLIMLESTWLKFRKGQEPDGEIINKTIIDEIKGSYLDVPTLHAFKSVLLPGENSVAQDQENRLQKLRDMAPFRFLEESGVTWNDVGSVLTDVFQLKPSSPQRGPVLPLDLLVLAEKERWQRNGQKIHVARLSGKVIEELIALQGSQPRRHRLLLVGADGEKSVVARKGGFGMLVNNQVPAFAHGCTFTWYMPIQSKGGTFVDRQSVRAGLQSRYRCFAHVVREGGEILGWMFYVGVQLTKAEFEAVKGEFADQKVGSKLFMEFRKQEAEVGAGGSPVLNARAILRDGCTLSNCQLGGDSLVSVTTFVVQGPHWRIFGSTPGDPTYVYAPPFLHQPSRNVLSLLVGDAFFGSHFFSGKGVNLAVQRSTEVGALLFKKGLLASFMSAEKDANRQYKTFQQEYRQAYARSLPQYLRSSHTPRPLSWETPSDQSVGALKAVCLQNFTNPIDLLFLFPRRVAPRMRAIKPDSKSASTGLRVSEHTLFRLFRDWLCPELQFGDSGFYLYNYPLVGAARKSFTLDSKDERGFYRYNFRRDLNYRPFSVTWLKTTPRDRAFSVKLLPHSEAEFVDGWFFENHFENCLVQTGRDGVDRASLPEKQNSRRALEPKTFPRARDHGLAWHVPTHKLGEQYKTSTSNFQEFSRPLLEQNMHELLRYLQYYKKESVADFDLTMLNVNTPLLNAIETELNRARQFFVPVKLIKTTDLLGKTSFSPSGKWLAVTDLADAVIYFIDTEQGTQEAFAPTDDSLRFAISHLEWESDAKMRVWVKKGEAAPAQKYVLNRQNSKWSSTLQDGPKKEEAQEKEEKEQLTLRRKNFTYTLDKKYNRIFKHRDSQQEVTLASTELIKRRNDKTRGRGGVVSIGSFDVSSDERFLGFTLIFEATIYLLSLSHPPPKKKKHSKSVMLGGAWVSLIRFSPSGLFVVAADANLKKVYLLENEDKVQEITCSEVIGSAEWTTDSRCVLLLGKKGGAKYLLRKLSLAGWVVSDFDQENEGGRGPFAENAASRGYTLSKDRSTILKKKTPLRQEEFALSPQIFGRSGLHRTYPTSFLIQAFDVSQDEKKLCFFLLGENSLYFFYF